MPKLNEQTALAMHRTMCRIRYFEEAASAKYKDGDLPGFIHLSIGQEACAVGVCATLEVSDYITSTHRGHGHCLAKGGDAKRMMAELFAKEAGYSKGRGGSMHIADVAVGMLGANGIVGQSMPLGVGAALTAQVKETGAVAVAFFGEGASGAGVAHEAMNMASLWRLPLVFFCEANRYAELSPYETHVPLANIADRAPAYDMPGVTIDGGDVVAVYETMTEAVARARAGQGRGLRWWRLKPIAGTAITRAIRRSISQREKPRPRSCATRSRASKRFSRRALASRRQRWKWHMLKKKPLSMRRYYSPNRRPIRILRQRD